MSVLRVTVAPDSPLPAPASVSSFVAWSKKEPRHALISLTSDGGETDIYLTKDGVEFAYRTHQRTFVPWSEIGAVEVVA